MRLCAVRDAFPEPSPYRSQYSSRDSNLNAQARLSGGTPGTGGVMRRWREIGKWNCGRRGTETACTGRHAGPAQTGRTERARTGETGESGATEHRRQRRERKERGPAKTDAGADFPDTTPTKNTRPDPRLIAGSSLRPPHAVCGQRCFPTKYCPAGPVCVVKILRG